MTVRDVGKNKRSVTFSLSSEATSKVWNATSLTVEMRQPISDGFTEQADVERLAASVLEVLR